jgi:hypothetical protein
MITKKEQETFARAYGAVHFCAELAEKLCDENGKLKPATVEQVETFKKACRDAACAAGALAATHDGRVA